MSIERLKFRGRVRREFKCGLSIDPTTWKAGQWATTEYEGLEMHRFWKFVFDGYIDPETVGQWTGRVDKNKVDIYKDDRCKFSISDTQHYIGVVVWLEEAMRFAFKTDDGLIRIPDDYYLLQCEVIGTVHDAPTSGEEL